MNLLASSDGHPRAHLALPVLRHLQVHTAAGLGQLAAGHFGVHVGAVFGEAVLANGQVRFVLEVLVAVVLDVGALVVLDGDVVVLLRARRLRSNPNIEPELCRSLVSGY